MNTFLNYLIEANIGLIFFYAIYWIILQKEDQFTFNRTYLLASIFASLVFPLFTVGISTPLIPSLSQTTAVQWLPEIVIYANGHTLQETNSTFLNWNWIVYLYISIAASALILFLFRIFSLITLFKRSTHYTWKKYTVAESDKVQGVFSFFHFIFLSLGEQLDETEKQEILRHEEVHIKKFHSIDIILIHLLSIVFWFNPVIRSYKKSFVQVHEFEADARSVEGHNVDEYCSLLAKVALQNNGYVLANHFTNSFTLKRITMMKTVRRKIKNWKVLTAACALPLFFFVVACQDQVMQDIQTIADNSSAATILPAQVEAELIKLKQANPKSEYIVMEMNEEGNKKLEELESDPVFKSKLVSMHVIKTEAQAFVILEKGEQTNRIADMTVSDGEVFTIVEQSAEPIGGMPKLYEYVAANLKYPEEAKSKGIEGRVFVEFVVNTDGSVENPHVIKGIGGGCDEAAIKVMESSPKWIPGKQRGKDVRQKMVIPIIFSLSPDNKFSIEKPQAKNDSEFVTTINKTTVNGRTHLNGFVKNVDGSPLTGTNVVIEATTTGTVVAQDGTFNLVSPTKSGNLVFSFVGFKTKIVNF